MLEWTTTHTIHRPSLLLAVIVTRINKYTNSCCLILVWNKFPPTLRPCPPNNDWYLALPELPFLTFVKLLQLQFRLCRPSSAELSLVGLIFQKKLGYFKYNTFLGIVNLNILDITHVWIRIPYSFTCLKLQDILYFNLSSSSKNVDPWIVSGWWMRRN